ncbi:hypothetical protein SSS_08896 [Sarcoptes scabiei]|nr:hypothetical protein SSS_08896 [Sarcoptes scabiei]
MIVFPMNVIVNDQRHQYRLLSMIKSWLLLQCLFSIWPMFQAFNLDTSIPVYKFGPKDSYFGYSVAEHIIKQSPSQLKSVNEIWINKKTEMLWVPEDYLLPVYFIIIIFY